MEGNENRRAGAAARMRHLYILNSGSVMIVGLGLVGLAGYGAYRAWILNAGLGGASINCAYRCQAQTSRRRFGSDEPLNYQAWRAKLKRRETGYFPRKSAVLVWKQLYGAHASPGLVGGAKSGRRWPRLIATEIPNAEWSMADGPKHRRANHLARNEAAHGGEIRAGEILECSRVHKSSDIVHILWWSSRQDDHTTKAVTVSHSLQG